MSQPRSSYAVGTGLFIVLGFAALAYLATQTSSVANVHQGDSYIVDTQFTNIGALKERAPVKIAGVRVGQVQSITLMPGHEVADVKLSIDKSYDKIPQDSVATIFTSGLLGDQYVGIQYGSAKQALAAGGTLARTKSTEPLEEMLGKFFGAGNVVDNVGGSYTVKADFTNVGSLSVGAPVKMAGVVIGSVQSVRADPVKLNAQVVLAIDKRYDRIPDDSAAAVFTSGLLGDQDVGIQYGSAKQAVVAGGTLARTKSTEPLEEMLGKFFGAGNVVDNVGGSYTVKADFTNVGSLSVGAPVKMAGVVIGSVQSVRADPVKLNAQVVLAIDKRYNTIPDDSAAAVFTSGLIGTQYVAIQPGGSPDMLKDGDEMILTQSAMQLEDLIGKFLVNGSPSDKKAADTGKSSDTPAGKH